ncbi:DUF2125 domain-containing protein [Shimia sp. SDUM112013]|uniref:DUF2125 domain-containing protein n=1 Tax=Shimia sp. SDUM112013 TaxID=3136160 RepID=UPI0032EBBDC9
MIEWKQIAGAGTLAVLFSSTAAFADVSPQEVWDNWRNSMTSFGYEVSATESMDGGTLTVSDIVLEMTFPEDEGDARVEMGSLVLQDQGDGTVSIDLPAEMPINVSAKADGETADFQIMLSYAGASVIASGSTDDLTYTYSIAKTGADLTSVVVNDEPIEDVDFTLALDNLQGVSQITSGEMTKLAQRMSASTLSYQMRAQDPEDGRFAMDAMVQDINFQGGGSVPEVDNPEDPVALFNAGFAFDGTFTQGPATIKIEGADQDGPFNADLASATSNLGIAIGPDGFDYSGKANEVTATIIGGGVPIPISAEMAEAAYGLKMPLLKGDGQQDVGMQLTLGGLTVSEMLWSMIDPGQVLPRDPATLSFDLAGKVSLFTDLIDEDAASMEAPGELNSLTLNSMLLEIAGARLSGDGAFTFDNTDMASFDGIPRPEGALNLNLKGANALIDKLVSMGLLPEDQAMAGRMMMGMFAVPVGEDELKSTIEINAEGHVLANGQRIQ